ncbi:Tf2-8, partial [Mucuna pruriens]
MGLQKRLEEAKGRWAKELPQTPFRLTFGTEAVIPVEIGEPSAQTALFEPGKNEVELRANLDMLQEIREAAQIREYTVKTRVARRYDKKVVPRRFNPQDLVLRKITQKAKSNKLTPSSEGPFRVIEEVGRGSYKLESLGGKKIPRMWNAASLRSIARAGYYWPSLKADCMDYVRRCDTCQRFADSHQAPAEQMHMVMSPWPFHKWGIDILGPFPFAPDQLKFLMVTVDYFTKWVEAEPMATITAERVKRFIWKKIICRFGLPAEIISDNGTQFASSATAKFCQELHIRQSFTSAEAANRVILRGLRRRLEGAKGRWAEELPHVLWSYHTTPHSTTGETPFRLTYGSEAVIPVEIGEPSPRTALFDPTANEEELRANLDLLQETREIAHIKEYAVKARAARRYDRRMIQRDFQEGDLVGRAIQSSRKGGKRGLSARAPRGLKNTTYLER